MKLSDILPSYQTQALVSQERLSFVPRPPINPRPPFFWREGSGNETRKYFMLLVVFVGVMAQTRVKPTERISARF